MEHLSNLSTERQNPHTTDIDLLLTSRLLKVINDEDSTVISNVRGVSTEIEKVVDHLVPLIREGGRLFYLGAGTSGRLGVLDASEIPPTYSAPYGQFIGIIAGGDQALRRAQEDSEDNLDAAVKDLEQYDLDPKLDTIMGIASSGRTPYVIGALKYGNQIGCKTVGIACVKHSEMEQYSDIMISCETGPEVVTGSTRMKAGTATKLILNMISTSTMIKAGKTYGNLMIDLMPSNLKLRDRTRRIFKSICGDVCYVLQGNFITSEPQMIPNNEKGWSFIDELIIKCGSLKVAILVGKTGMSIPDAKGLIDAKKGNLRMALDYSSSNYYSDLSRSSQLTPSLSNSSINACFFADKSLCIDVSGRELKACIFKHGYFLEKSATLKDVITDFKKVLISFLNEIKEPTPNGFSYIESVRIGVENLDVVAILLDTLESLDIAKSKIKLVHGQANYVDLISKLT